MGCRAPTLSPQMMQTNVPGVFAAGDAVTFPLAWRNNRKVNIPHWQMAHAQGMASPMARSGAGGCPGVSASPLPPLHCWPWVLVTGLVVAGSVVACVSSLIGAIEPAQGKPCGPPPEPSFQHPEDTPSSQGSAPAWPPFYQPLLSFCPYRHTFCTIPHPPVQAPGERGKGCRRTWASSPLSASVSNGPLDWICGSGFM